MSPRKKEDNEQIRTQRQQQIELTALELFALHGYHRTSISEIAKACDISKGLMYNYFDSKEALLESVLLFVMTDAADDIFNELVQKSKTLSPKKLLRHGIELFFTAMQVQAKFWKLSISLSMQVADMPRIHSVMTGIFQKYFVELEALLKAGKVENPAIRARLIAAQLDGIALHYIVLGDDYNLQAVKKMLLNDIEKLSNSDT